MFPGFELGKPTLHGKSWRRRVYCRQKVKSVMDDADAFFVLLIFLFILEGAMVITASVTGYEHGKGIVYERLLEQHNVAQPAEEATEL